MADNANLVKPRTVTLYPVHWASIDAFAKDAGFNSTSAALRRIVDEWLKLNGRSHGRGTGIKTILDAYLAQLITADEALEALAGHYEQVTV